MARLKYTPVVHDHETFLNKAGKKLGFTKTYNELEKEYALAAEELAAKSCAVLTMEELTP